jgi:hypothetical protein
MRLPSTLSSLGLLLFSATLAGCAADSASSANGFSDDSSADAGRPSPGAPGDVGQSADATRAVEEADIIQVEGSRLYAMSRSRGISIIDISSPNRLARMGAPITLPGAGFEMFRRGDVLFAMTNGAIGPDGSLQPPSDEAPAPNDGLGAPELDSATYGSALLVAVDVRDPANAKKISMFKVPGEIADSRVVGDVLYLVSYESGECWSCSGGPRTVVTSFDVSDPTSIRRVDQIAYAPDQPGYTGWKRSVAATKDRLYVAGPDWRWDGREAAQSVIQVLDVTDPEGHLAVGAEILIPGQVTSRWQMDEHDGVLRVVAQRDQLTTQNGNGAPLVSTFAIESSSTFAPLGSLELELPWQEKLKSVRFDGTRAYAITFRDTDPLFTIDLSDPATPLQKGELHMPGWVHHMEPRGDRLIGLGFDPTMPGGWLNVSLFDVSDLEHPQILDRVSFGEHGTELPEDQNRIHKALRVFDDASLIAVPFTTRYSPYYGVTSCEPHESGIQLIDWQGDGLWKRGVAEVRGEARRAFLHEDRLLAVSDTNVRSFSIANFEAPTMTADLSLGECTLHAERYPDHGYPHGHGHGYYGDGDMRGGMFCATSPNLGGRVGAGASALFGLVALGLVTRRRRRG